MRGGVVLNGGKQKGKSQQWRPCIGTKQLLRNSSYNNKSFRSPTSLNRIPRCRAIALFYGRLIWVKSLDFVRSRQGMNYTLKAFTVSIDVSLLRKARLTNTESVVPNSSYREQSSSLFLLSGIKASWQSRRESKLFRDNEGHLQQSNPYFARPTIHQMRTAITRKAVEQEGASRLAHLCTTSGRIRPVSPETKLMSHSKIDRAASFLSPLCWPCLLRWEWSCAEVKERCISLERQRLRMLCHRASWLHVAPTSTPGQHIERGKR